MKIFRSLEEVPADFGPTILSVGNFDGIHCGHLSVLKEVTERARLNHSKAMAVTFEPHPFRILRPDVTVTSGRRMRNGCGSKVTAMALLWFRRARSVTSFSTLRCPQWIPSKFPTLRIVGPKSAGTSSSERNIFMRSGTPASARHAPAARVPATYCSFRGAADRGRYE